MTHLFLAARLVCVLFGACVLLLGCSAPTALPNIAPNYMDAPLDLSTPQNTAYSMMMAMYRGDTAMVDAVFAPDGALLRLRSDRTISRDALPRWREWVGTLEVGSCISCLSYS